MKFVIEIEREDDGRWIAEVPDLPGVMTYGQSRDEAIARVQALALRVLAERLEHGEAAPDLLSVSFQGGTDALAATSHSTGFRRSTRLGHFAG